MTNSILIGETIYKKLSKSDTLKKYLGNKIYPLVAENGEQFPYIVFYRDDIRAISCKDGYYEDAVTFTVAIISNKYIESLEIANEVRKILEKQRIKDENLTITNATIDGVEEVWENNAYTQRLHFLCKTE